VIPIRAGLHGKPAALEGKDETLALLRRLGSSALSEDGRF
jgi:hypothetical protein